MPSGAIFAVADYLPCLGCEDVRLVEQVRIAELTDDVRAAIADGSLFEPRCEVCHQPFPLKRSCLLVTPEVVLVVPDGEEADLDVAGWLLLELRQRRGLQPAELFTVSRAALRDPDGTRIVQRIPPALWASGPPPTLAPPGPESRRAAYAALVELFDQSGATPTSLRKLARAHIRCYAAFGELDSLTAAREVARRATEAAPTPRERSQALSLCGAVAMLDYERVGDVEFVREAAAAYREALAADPADTLAAGGLGPALQLLAAWDDDPAMLDAGVDTLRRAVATADGDRAVRLNNLGSALSSRAELTHSQDDLTEAAVALSEAIELTPGGAPEAAARWNNLGTVRRRIGAELGETPLLEAAIEAFERSVEATAPADPAWPGRWANLAEVLWRRDGPGDRARARELHRGAAGADTADPGRALTAASNWCRIAFQEERWEMVAEAYERALAISDALLDRQLTGAARRARLRAVQRLPDLAAFAWARRGDGLAAAGALEAGRARLLADALELVAARVPPEREAPRARAVRAVEVAERRLEDAGPGEREHAVIEVRRLRSALADVTAEIDAAALDPLAAMAHLARSRPLVYVARTPAGTVAAVVHGDPLVAQLVEVPVDETELASALAAALAPLLAGHEVVTFSLPAALAHVSMAAAPYGDGECLLDHHAITLLPCAAVAGTAHAAANAPRLGGVANPAREDVGALTFAASELRTAGASLPAAEADLLLGAQATVDAVLAVVGRCTHLHFACHGRFSPESPLESALLLTDGDLSVRRMQRADRSADLRLLVLSACESAQTDARLLPDETIGLSTAFLQVGAQAVIGALWPVPDLPTKVLMARLYRELGEHDGDPERALRGAQNWLRQATTAELTTFLAAPSPGDPDGALLAAGARVLTRAYAPGERPFAAPSIWAAFVVFGAATEGVR